MTAAVTVPASRSARRVGRATIIDIHRGDMSAVFLQATSLTDVPRDSSLCSRGSDAAAAAGVKLTRCGWWAADGGVMVLVIVGVVGGPVRLVVSAVRSVVPTVARVVPTSARLVAMTF